MATPSQLPPQLPHFPPMHGTLGALEIGTMISIALFGVVTMQTYNYYHRFPNDAALLKSLVAIVWVCELGHAICVSHTIYEFTITQYGNPLSLIHPPKSLSLAIIFSGVSTPLIQGFLAWRVRTLSKGYIIPAVSWILAFVRFLGSLASTVKGVQMQSLPQFLHDYEWLLTSVLSVGLANDIIVTGALVWALTQSRATAQKRTIAVIDQLVVWTVQTGLITSVSGIAMMTLFLTEKQSFAWLAIFTFLARMYSNSLLAVLNGRTKLRNLQSDHQTITVTPSAASAVYESQRGTRGHLPINIEMSKTVRTNSDMEDRKMGWA